MQIKFPSNFWWGAATSGPQSEGRFNKEHANMFDYWYDIEPEAFYDQFQERHSFNEGDRFEFGT